jgi:flagellar biosynthesis/type III secretory pathway chaperone
MIENSIEVQISTLIELSEDLQAVLEQERSSLAERDLDALALATQRKTDLCGRIDAAVTALGPTPISEQLATLDKAQERRLQPLHTALVALAEANRNYNATNGKILHRSQQSVRELINMLSGTNSDVLYEQSGQTAARATGTAIAKA